MSVKCAMRKAFSLVELLLVVVIIGIMAAFFMPGFSKTIKRAKASDSIANLSLVCGANAIYKSKNGYNFAPSGVVSSISSINSGLGLNIIPNGLSYSCGSHLCTATVSGDFSTTVDLNAGVTASNPLCSGTYCP